MQSLGYVVRVQQLTRILILQAVATLFFAPLLSIALAAIDIAALERSVNDRHRDLHLIESQLAASRSQLDAQHAQLAAERASRDRLAASMSSLRDQAAALATEVLRLQAARTELAELSVRINDCLHTVDAALSSSKTIADMCSMRNVVSGVRGVVGALGEDAMFAGPLALLDDAALDRLDSRVGSLKRLQLAVRRPRGFRSLLYTPTPKVGYTAFRSWLGV